MMKQLGPLNLSFIFAGCFLGAGYVSGQELWQFFGTYGFGGYIGLVLAVALLFLFSFLTLSLVQLSDIHEMDKILIPWDLPVLRFAVGALETIFQFGTTAIMCAGIGALLDQLFGLPPYVGSGTFCLIVLAMALLGLKGLVSTFSVSVPILIVATLIFGAISLGRNELSTLSIEASSKNNPLLGGWCSGAVVFSCFNIFGTIGILIPFGDYIKSKKTIIFGLSIGSAALLLIALSVLVSMGFAPYSVSAELPMLLLAGELGQSFGYVYAILLSFAMFGTALSSFVAMLDFLVKKFSAVEKHQVICAAIFIVFIYLSSLFGFGDLISVVYPIFGYSSVFFLLTMLIHYIKLLSARRRKKHV